MDHIYMPPLGTRTVVLHDEYHFADDDPMLYPQPYSEQVAFLAVIPRQTRSTTISAAFYKPSPSDFVLNDPTRPWLAIGHLAPLPLAKVKLMALDLHEKYRKLVLSSNPNETDILVRKIDRLMHYDVAIQRLLQRLSIPSPQDDCFKALYLLQRTCLEFAALFNWVTKYRIRCNQRTEKWDLLDVVGAFTDDLDVADGFFYAGIPVWVVHPLKDLPKLRIETLVEPLPLTHQRLPIGTDAFLDIQVAQPPRKPVFIGHATDLSRYQAMSMFLKSLVSTGLLSPPIHAASLGPVRRPFKHSRSRSRNVQGELLFSFQNVSDVSSGTIFHRRNKYVDVESPRVPPSIPSWRVALAALSFDQDHQREGVNAGYALPDPGLFVSPANDETKAQYLAMWLKIRDIMIHRLLSSFEPLPNKLWRSILAIEKTTPRTDSREGQLRAQAMCLLQDAAKASMGDNFSMALLTSNTPSWRGTGVERTQDLVNPQLSREILWELYEINFRFEFASLDAVLHKSGIPLQEREIIIDGNCWPYASRIPDLDTSKAGLNDRDVFKRKDFLQGLHLVMSDWSDPRPPCLRNRFPFIENTKQGVEYLEKIEAELAEFYVKSFYRIFGRAAIVPHFFE